MGSEAKLNLRIPVPTQITVTRSLVSAQVREESRAFLGPQIGIRSPFCPGGTCIHVVMGAVSNPLVIYPTHWQLTLGSLREAVLMERPYKPDFAVAN